MDRSLRRDGQLLVVVGALLGATVEVVPGLSGQDAPTGTAVAVGRTSGAGLAVTASSSQPSTSRPVASKDQADGQQPRAGRAAPVGGPT